MKNIKITDPKLVEEFEKAYKEDKLIIFPTETCYGVGANPQSDRAVTRLLKYKNRPAGKAISVAVSTKKKVTELIEIPQKNQEMVNKFLPGPITVVGNSKKKVDPRLEAPDKSLGLRIPAYPPLLEILDKTNLMITATSANLSGKPNPYSPEQLLAQLTEKKKEAIGLIIDAGELAKNPPSLVIDLRQKFEVYREGLLSKDDILSGEIYNADSEDESIKIAKDWLSERLNNKNKEEKKQLVLLLTGELGAGKTTFTKGLAKALQIKDNVNSPTFNYVSEYLTEKSVLFHADLWRLDSKKITLAKLGINPNHIRYKNINKENKLVVIEWPEKLDFTELSKKPENDYKIINIKIFKTGKNSRRIVINQGKEK